MKQKFIMTLILVALQQLFFITSATCQSMPGLHEGALSDPALMDRITREVITMEFPLLVDSQYVYRVERNNEAHWIQASPGSRWHCDRCGYRIYCWSCTGHDVGEYRSYSLRDNCYFGRVWGGIGAGIGAMVGKIISER